MSFVTKKVHVNGPDLQLHDVGTKNLGPGHRKLMGEHRCIAQDLRGWGGSDKKAGSYT